jgi:hypothetical protein
LAGETELHPALQSPERNEAFMFSKPGILLRIEGALEFGLSLIFYQAIGASWWIFWAAFLWPDLFLLGYLVSARLGARLYNLVHTSIFPFALVGVSYCEQSNALMSFALIWLAHIGLDRALGFGLKYRTFFRDTHLQRVN